MKEISETISNNSDLFEIEEKNKITEHQIDLISMDHKSEEIDEKVLRNTCIFKETSKLDYIEIFRNYM